MAAGWITKVVITRTKLAIGIDNGPAVVITVGAVYGAVGLGWLVQKVYHWLKTSTQIPGEYIEEPRRDDRCETVATLFGAAIGGVAAGLATEAVITGTTIASVNHGPAIAISLGAVGGAVGGGWLAKEA